MNIKKIDSQSFDFFLSSQEVTIKPRDQTSSPKKSYDSTFPSKGSSTQESLTMNQKQLKETLKNFNKLIETLNKRLDPLSKELKVEIDQELNLPIFKILDKETKEVLRQIPWEETLKLLKYFREINLSDNIKLEKLKGLLLQKEV